MAQLVLANILAGSGNVLAGGDNGGNVTKVTIGSNLTLSGGVLSAIGGGSGSVTSVAVSRSGDALVITGSPITSSGTINIGFAGTGSQYIKGDGTLATFPTTILQAQKLVTEVYNETGATLTKGTIVYINGGHGNLPTVTKAIATGDSTSAQTYGVVQSDITNNNNGYVVVIGSLGDLDTSAYAVGAQLYLSGTTAGAWTSTKPSAPIHLVYIGIVVRSHPTQGVVEIRIQNGYELEELHNVQITSVANGDILQYDSTTSLWKNVAGTTTNIAEGTNLYFTNARARAVLSTNVGSALTYNSSTGRFTLNAADSGTDGYLTAADWTDFDSKQANLGTGTTSQYLRGDLTWAAPPAPALEDLTDVTITSPTNGQLLRYQLGSWINFTPSYVSAGFFSATAPLAYNSTTGVFSISQANTTTSGYLSSTDWNTFNNKQDAGNYITDLTGEATASGPGSVAITLTNSAVIGKVLTGLNVTGGSVSATDSILTAFGKVQNQINGLIGGSIYKGTWNASTNTPTLASSVGTAGWYYIVSVAGSTNLNGITDWNVGDWAIFNGGVWQKVDNTDSVVSVNGFTGAVSLTTDNISEGATNLYYTNTRARGALSANPGSALTYNSSTGRFTLNAADGTVEGYVTAADYNYWDSKQDSLGTGTTSQWLRGDLTWSTVPAPALDDLTDVTITTPSNGQLLRYQAGTWINFTPTYIVAGYLSATAPLSYNSGTGVFSISQATTSTNGYLSSTDWNTFNGKQPQLNGTGFVKASGTTISYDNNTYLTTSAAASTYLPLTGGTLTGALIGTSANFSSPSIIGDNSGNVMLYVGTSGASPRTYPTAIQLDNTYLNSAGVTTALKFYLYKNGTETYGFGLNNASGVEYHTAGVHQFYTASGGSASVKAMMTNGGNFLINTTTDAGYKLDVAGVGRFNRTGSGGDVLTVLGPNGYANNIFLGVPGTTAEGLRLTYNSTNGSSEINNIYNASLFFKTNDTTRLTISGSGAATFSSSVTAGSNIVLPSGYELVYGTGTVSILGNTTTNVLDFRTSNTPRITINSSGNVGIGTSSPNAPLHVQMPSDGSSGVIFRYIGGTANPGLFISVNETTKHINLTGSGSSVGGQQLRLGAEGNANVLNIGGSNVLIGTTTDAGYKIYAYSSAFYFGNDNGATASPSYIHTGNNYSNGETRDKCKIYLYNSGSEKYGFSVGSAGDVQYHSNAYHRFYIANTKYLEITSTITASTTITATGFFESSDKRIKKELIDNPTSVNIENVKPKLYIKDGKRELGYYAQDLQNILPSSVTEGKDGFLSLSYTQVHTAKIAALENKIEELEALIKTLIK